MGVLRNGLNLFRVNSFWQQAITGFILVAACAVEVRRHRKST
jgi:ribose transport system permease protein